MGTMRDRMVEAGMTLFGERGYDATSVADIQVACGLTAGSGALYKHFPSKQALLAEGLHRYVASVGRSRVGLMEVLPDAPRRALEVIADAVAAAMAGDGPVIRVVLRDLERFPDLLAELWDGLLAALYVEIADWLRALQGRGSVAITHPAAAAAVPLAPPATLTWPPSWRRGLIRPPPPFTSAREAPRDLRPSQRHRHRQPGRSPRLRLRPGPLPDGRHQDRQGAQRRARRRRPNHPLPIAAARRAGPACAPADAPHR